MFSRIAWIYRIYAAQHSERSLPARRIGRIGDPIPGYLEHIVFKDGFVRVRGWCLCDQIVFRSDQDELVQTPTGDRQDVSNSHGCDPRVGFEAAVLCKSGPVTVELRRGTATQNIEVPIPKRRGKFPVILSLLNDLLRGTPQILKAALFEKHRLKAAVKSALKLTAEKPVRPLDLTVLAPAPNPCPSLDKTITIILPVFNAFDVLQDCLTRIRDHTDLPWRMI